MEVLSEHLKSSLGDFPMKDRVVCKRLSDLIFLCPSQRGITVDILRELVESFLDDLSESESEGCLRQMHDAKKASRALGRYIKTAAAMASYKEQVTSSFAPVSISHRNAARLYELAKNSRSCSALTESQTQRGDDARAFRDRLRHFFLLKQKL